MLLLAAAGFGSCKGDQESKIHFDNKVFISGRSFVDDIFIKRDNLETRARASATLPWPWLSPCRAT